MINEAKIKEKIAKILDDNTGYEFDNIKALDQLYQLFTPSLEALGYFANMHSGILEVCEGKNSENDFVKWMVTKPYKLAKDVLEKLNGD